MIKTLLIVMVLLAVVFLLLGIQILFKKNGKFPSTHIEDNEHLKKYGITCASHDEYEQCKTKNNNAGCESCGITCSMK